LIPYFRFPFDRLRALSGVERQFSNPRVKSEVNAHVTARSNGGVTWQSQIVESTRPYEAFFLTGSTGFTEILSLLFLFNLIKKYKRRSEQR
jgi:hypothetical protein